MVLIIDNYDSFSYNLVQMAGVINPDIRVVRNDECTVDEIKKMAPSHIVLSSGSGYPKNAGICESVVTELGGKIPILGVCLGHQAICEAFGGEIVLAPKLMHGRKSKIKLLGNSPIFEGLPPVIDGARYHSLVCGPDSLPEVLEVTATGTGGEIMAVKHRDKDIYGVQFHPESILTATGDVIMKNFLSIGSVLTGAAPVKTERMRVMIQKAINDIMDGKNLDFETTETVMYEMMDGTATPAQIGSFLTAMRMKGETVEEITACATAMRDKGLKISPGRDVIDIVGTGGDKTGTFNISTTSAFVVAAGGVPVAKHGNRGSSSKSGAADVLEWLGANLNLTAEQNERILAEEDICFMFAQVYHSSMRYAAPVRKEMGARTIFNILGPLANPAEATMQLLGVYDMKLVDPLSQVLGNLGVNRGLVVCGRGMDEATLTGETAVCEIRFGDTSRYSITPEQYGFKRCKLEEIQGGDPVENAEITTRILSGADRGPKRDMVILNAALSLYLGTDDCTVEDCIPRAREIIDSGAAYEKLQSFIRITNEI